MVLPVEEVHLILQLLHVPLIGLVLVLLGDLVHVLAALVKFAESHYFIVSDLDLVLQLARLTLDLQVLLH